jgi:5'-nucleotidase
MTPSSSGTLRLRASRLLALALVAVLAFPAVALGAQPADRVAFWLTILHNNDGESKLLGAGDGALADYGGIARFATVVDELKREATSGRPAHPGAPRGVVMLSSGDNFLAGAQFAASLDKGVPYYDSIGLGLIGYDAMAIGNHEFDFGPDVLADFIEGFPSDVPFVSSNLDVSAEPELAELAAAGRLVSSTIVRERNARIGIIGATTPQLPNISSPRNVEVDDDVAGAIQGQVAALEGAGVDMIILISHLQDVDEDLELATMLSGIDVMIAGGGDELLANPGDLLVPGDVRSDALPYPLTATDVDGDSIPVITTAGDYKYVGKLVVGFNAAGEVIQIDNDASGPVRISSVGPDAVTSDPVVQAAVVDPVEEYVAELDANVLATSEVPLNGLRGSVVGGVIEVEGIRNSETNLGNLTADSMLWQAQTSASDFGVDAPQVAMQNGGGIRNNSIIAAGPITELNTYEILAFTNFVSVKEDMSAAQFKAVLETSVSDIGNGRFGQWAGVTFTYDPAAQPRVIDSTTCAVGNPGSRVQDVTVDGTLVFDDGGFVGPAGWTVDLATNDFTFRGGDCYDFGPGGFTTVGVTYQQALANYLVAPAGEGGLNGLISAAQYPVGGEGRIVRLP